MSDNESEEIYEKEADYYAEAAEEIEEISEEEQDEETEIDEDILDSDTELEVVEKKEKKIDHSLKIDIDNKHYLRRIIPPDERCSSHIIQFSEMVEAIGIRITQIESGSPVFTDVSGYSNPIDMAKKEFIDRRNPLLLIREMQRNGNISYVEEWKVREMTFPVLDREILDITDKQLEKIIK